MIDWWGLARNIPWILGLSICLAALSMASYRARARQIYPGAVLREPGSQLALAIGLLLFCLGILATSQTLWQALSSGLLVILFAGQIIHLWRQQHHKP